MRAVRFHRHGPPADVLQVDTVETPEPGPGEVRIRLTHRPVNPADLSAVAGTYGLLRSLPAVGGNEGAGYVEALGEGVAGLAVGQRVVKLGDAPTWQESVVVPAEDALAVPDGLTDEAAAQLFVNPLTARLLLDAAPTLAPGDALVLTAGGSTVSRLVAQMAVRRGLRPVALVRSGAHEADLRALRMTVVVGEVDTPEARAALRDATGERGAAAVFDAVAGAAGALALSALGDGGTHVVYGALGRAPLPVDAGALLYRGVTVRGVWRTRWFRETPRSISLPILSALAEDAAAGVFTLPVHATFDLAHIADAVRASTAPGHIGKVLLTG
ncbi:MAG TPA: zinc-dependent alcohol dehydrogenase family protein [Rubricoccaceae bacterium]|jgi:NADPH2:quinone reductase